MNFWIEKAPPPPRWHFSQNSFDFVAGPFPLSWNTTKMYGRASEFSLARAINNSINSGSPHPTHTPLSHPPQITDMCQDSLISHKIRKAGWLNAQSFIIFMGGGGWNAPAEVGPDWFRHSPLKDCQRTPTHCHSYFSCPGR